MLECLPLEIDNIKRLETIYKRFQTLAETQYRWDMAAVEFNNFQIGLSQGAVEGYMLLDKAKAQNQPNDDIVGFALFKQEAHRSIEMNVIHLEPEVSKKAALDCLMRRMLADWLERPDWDVVSYAMLGVQEELIMTMTWYGFKPAGQTIVRLNFLDPIVMHVLKNQKDKAAPLPEGYRLLSWSDAFRKVAWRAEVAEVVHLAFKDKSDALWDPRFRTLEGARGIVQFIANGDMGQHLEQASSLLLKQDENGEEHVVGFCFLVQTDVSIANIPLVGILPSEHGHGFGVELMRFTLFRVIDQIVRGQVGLTEINATLDTDNGPAIKMYRRFGFQEDYNYPHVYLTREKALAGQAGEWCLAPPM
jgi:ribosomal protein S18 acetylase RimI-like enzyme